MRLPPRTRTERCGAFLVLFLLLTASSGCGSRGTVSGKVTYNDGTETKTLRGGTVIFTSGDGKTLGRSSIAEDGSYSVPKIPRGKVKVGVETQSARPVSTPPAGRNMTPPADANLPPSAAAMYNRGANADRYVEIPESYSNPDKSGIEFEATGSDQNHNIELK